MHLLESQDMKIYVGDGCEPETLPNGKFIFDPHLSYLMFSNLRKGDCMVDVGANIGYFSSLAAKCVGSSGKVIAFEPDMKNASLCSLNAAINGHSNVSTLMVAAGDGKVSKGNLHLSVENPGDHRTWEDSKEIRKSFPIIIRSIDSFNLDRIDLLKIDVQGDEVKVLQGARNTILNQKKMTMFIEFWPKGLRGSGNTPEEFVDLVFKEFGFTMYSFGRAEEFPLLIMQSKKTLLDLVKILDDPNNVDFLDLWCLRTSW